MCGIVGAISSVDYDFSHQMANAVNSLKHRGPDTQRFQVLNETACFGHTRLSIIDLSDHAAQPMTYQDRYVIAFNGEIYNYIELKNELIELGHVFKNNSDTEMILAAFSQWGTNCLSKFNGMWAFAIYDLVEKKLFISRDRFSVKPLFFSFSNNKFIFASEIKAILEFEDVVSEINEEYLDYYIKNGPNEWGRETIFNKVFRFPGASYFYGDYSDLFGSFKIQKFWNVKFTKSLEPFNEKVADEYTKKYLDLLTDAVRLRCRADVEVGTALSGGLDSSSIAWLVNKILREQGVESNQKTFSSVYPTFDRENSDESEFINIVAKNLNVSSFQIEPKENEIPHELENLIKIMENPPESTCMSGWHTFRLVGTTNVKITLDGQGADEQLGGYLFYIVNYLSHAGLRSLLRETSLFIKNPGAKKYALKGFAVGFLRCLVGIRMAGIILKLFGKNFPLLLNEQMEIDFNHNLINLIHYSDRVSMGHSIESRMPFMDYRLVEFLASVPGSYKIHNGWTKYIARKAFSDKLPDDICWRKDKLGWPIPEKKWFEGNLSQWFNATLNSSVVLKKYKKNYLESENSIVKKIRFLNVALLEKQFNFKNFSE